MWEDRGTVTGTVAVALSWATCQSDARGHGLVLPSRGPVTCQLFARSLSVTGAPKLLPRIRGHPGGFGGTREEMGGGGSRSLAAPPTPMPEALFELGVLVSPCGF